MVMEIFKMLLHWDFRTHWSSPACSLYKQRKWSQEVGKGKQGSSYLKAWCFGISCTMGLFHCDTFIHVAPDTVFTPSHTHARTLLLIHVYPDTMLHTHSLSLSLLFPLLWLPHPGFLLFLFFFKRRLFYVYGCSVCMFLWVQHTYLVLHKNSKYGAWEMAYQSGALDVLPQDPGLIPTWWLTALCDSSSRRSGAFWPPPALETESQ